MPAGRAAELDDRRDNRRRGEQLGGLADPDPAVAREQAHPVRERNDPLEPVLGEQHRDADVVHEAGQGGQDLLGRGRVQRRGGLVEDEQAGVHGEHRADRDPLLLPPGERAQVAVPQVGDPEQVEGLLDPAAHRVAGQPELLHAVGELLLDGVGDEAGGRVLPDVPHDVGALPWRMAYDARAVEQHVAVEVAAAEARHQPGDHPEQRGLADPGRAGDQHELALLDRQVDAVEDRGGVVVGEADTAQLDHAATSRRSGAGALA